MINHRPESCVYSTLVAYLAHVFAMTQPRWSSSFLLVMTPTKTRLGRVASASVFLLMRFWLSIHSSSSWRSGGSPDKSLSTATRSESILEPRSKHYVFINRVWPKHLKGKIRFNFDLAQTYQNAMLFQTLDSCSLIGAVNFIHHLTSWVISCTEYLKVAK